MAVDYGGGTLLSQVYWSNSTISLPLDTMSVYLSEYRNTTITSTSIAYSNLDSLTGSKLPSQVSLVLSSIQAESLLEFAGYAGFPTCILANGTDGAVSDGVTSFAYPTPYAAIAGFMLFTNLASASCALDSDEADFLFEDIYQIGPGLDGDRERSVGLGNVEFHMKRTFYRTFDIGGESNVMDIFHANFGAFSLDTKLFSEHVASDTSLMELHPYLASCRYYPFGIGPPVLQLPVTALTATVTTTIKEDSPFPTNGAAPGNTVRPSVPAQTTTLQKSPSNPGSLSLGSSNASPTSDPKTQHIAQSVKYVPSQPGSDSNPPIDHTPSPVDGNPVSASKAGIATLGSNIPQASAPAKTVAAAPQISYAGTIIEPDEASQYDLPNIGTISPGGPAVTADNIIYSLAPSATALVSNGVQVSITPIAKEASIESFPPGILAFGGTTYIADASSHFIIARQTVNPARPAVTVAGTPISLAADASIVVIGGSTVPIAYSPTIDIPTATPTLTFAGSSYTADVSSAFVIDDQTLSPGGSIEVHGTPILYPSHANKVVVDGTTQSLSYDEKSSPAAIAPVLTLARSSYTADASSVFTIEGQTLTPGAAITVHGTRVSYPTSGGEVVIGSSTQSLSFATTTASALEAPIFTFDGTTYTADASSHFIIDGQTLVPGSVITVSGTPFSYTTGRSGIIIGTSNESFSFATITPPPPTAITAAIISIDGSTYTADASSDFLIAGQTLTPNGIITISGTPISYAATRTAVIIGTSTEALSYTTITPTAAPIITFNGSTYTALGPSSGFVIDGQTLTPGGLITVSGTPISYAAARTDVVIGKSTEAVGIGGLIMSGLGGGATSTNIVEFAGSAVGRREWSGTALGIALGITMLVNTERGLCF